MDGVFYHIIPLSKQNGLDNASLRTNYKASVLLAASSRRARLFASNWAHATSQSASFRSQTPVIGLLQQS